MKILLTGASSLTGFWFARELRSRGHEVHLLLRRPPDAYSETRGRRVALLQDFPMTTGASFGEDSFLKAIRDLRPLDVLCHHASETDGYRSEDFDPLRAASSNSHRIREVLRALGDANCGRIILTGTVFEPAEGLGDSPVRAFSPYGLSKGLTAATFEYYCWRAQVTLDRFIIANPFGAYEDPKFTTYLVRTWLAGQRAVVSAPRYIRDNVPVDLLAASYAELVEDCAPGRLGRKHGPSFYVESNGAFATRVAAEFGARAKLPCDVLLSPQLEFPEPITRINVDPIDAHRLGWRETSFWDSLADYYLEGVPGAVR